MVAHEGWGPNGGLTGCLDAQSDTSTFPANSIQPKHVQFVDVFQSQLHKSLIYHCHYTAKDIPLLEQLSRHSLHRSAHGTTAKPLHRATRHTPQQSSSGADVSATAVDSDTANVVAIGTGA